MDELFYTPHQAAEWVSAQTRPAITPQQLFQYSERGSLPICFRYRGNLGVFENPRGIIDGAIGAHDLFPVEQRHIYFDGYLRSLSPCQLQVTFKKILPKPAEWTEDLLNPRAVDVAGAPVHCHPPLPDLPEGCYLGRAREDGRLDTGNVPNTEWLYAASDLAGLVSLIAPVDAQQIEPFTFRLEREKDGYAAAIREVAETLYRELGKNASGVQAWSRLQDNPPGGYRIAPGKGQITMPDELPLPKTEFMARWRKANTPRK